MDPLKPLKTTNELIFMIMFKLKYILDISSEK